MSTVHPNNDPSTLLGGALAGIGIAFTLICVLAFGTMLIDKERKSNIIAQLEEQRDHLQVDYMNQRYDIAQLRTSLMNNHPDVLWLARTIYSETNKPSEMLYVGWVIRNRVEAGYAGRNTYREVVLDPYQFSAFNANRTTGRYTRQYFMTRDVTDNNRLWQSALDAARTVYFAKHSENVFNDNLVLYFYSEISMPAHRPHPHWASAFQQVEVEDVDEYRFRFFRNPNYRGGNQSPARPSTTTTSAR